MNTPIDTSTGHRIARGVWRRLSGRSRATALRVGLATSVALVTCLVTIGGVATTGSPAAAAAGPACTFTGPAIGALVVNVTAGESINVDCTGFPANHPYLLIETSLLVAIDPAAAPLLQGQTTSLPGLLALISALPEMNAQSTAYPTSNSSGVLNYNYTVPTSQPLDPNATCPPTTEELNSGLIGCAVAMIDLETFKPVTEGTFVLNYKGQPYFPPDPTLALGSAIARKGQYLSLSDAPGATTYWWLATLVSLYANLAGSGGSSGPIPVVVKVGGRKSISNAAVTPASYNGTTLTPPILSGQVYLKRAGKVWVKVSLNAKLLGIPVSNAAQAKLRILGAG